MDVEFLSRLQFAFTIMFHYLYASISIGLALILVVFEWVYIKTNDDRYKLLAQFWTKIMGLTFVFGVASGIVMEFEFGTNLASYSRFTGQVFGSPLVAEGIFSFFLESIFLGILVFGWKRVSRHVHFFSTLMVCLGAHLSAVWIIVANSWMHTPAGFRIVGEGINRHVEITDFWAMVMNPSMTDRLSHVIVGAWLAGAFLVISISAYFILKRKFLDSSLFALKVGLSLASLSLALALMTGDMSARTVARMFPTKLASYEGIFTTQQGAPLSVCGIVNTAEQRIEYQIAIPNALSFLAYGDIHAEVKGLESVPDKDRPNVPIVFQAYHLMILSWALMVGVVVATAWYLKQKSLLAKSTVLHILAFSVVIPHIGNQAGWVATEMGRYPWVVHDLLRISEGMSKTVPAEQIMASIILFFVVYTILFILYLYLLLKSISARFAAEKPC